MSKYKKAALLRLARRRPDLRPRIARELRKMRLAKEKYPWDQCIKDQMKQYGDMETAKKVCGKIKAESQGKKARLYRGFARNSKSASSSLNPSFRDSVVRIRNPKSRNPKLEVHLYSGELKPREMGDVRDLTFFLEENSDNLVRRGNDFILWLSKNLKKEEPGTKMQVTDDSGSLYSYEGGKITTHRTFEIETTTVPNSGIVDILYEMAPKFHIKRILFD